MYRQDFVAKNLLAFFANLAQCVEKKNNFFFFYEHADSQLSTKRDALDGNPSSFRLRIYNHPLAKYFQRNKRFSK